MQTPMKYRTPLAPPPTPTALDFLQASRLASCLRSKAAGVGNVTSSERSQTGPVPSVLVNHTGREGRGQVSRQPSPPWGESSLSAPVSGPWHPVISARSWGPCQVSEGFVSHPRVIPSPRQDLQPSKHCQLEPSGETGTDCVRRGISLSISFCACSRRR